jgi:catechol 2,3-dioxygenase-like lactoylglutathione lyase family enzyme
MFSHIAIGSNDIDRSRRFYDALFDTAAMQDDKGRLAYRRKGAALLVGKPLDGEPACCANGGTIGFSLDSPEEVDAWHQRGLAAGGTSIEDPPGYRDLRFGRLYLAYLRDPDGNKLCGLHRPAQ